MQSGENMFLQCLLKMKKNTTIKPASLKLQCVQFFSEMSLTALKKMGDK